MSYSHGGNAVTLPRGKTDFRVRYKGFPHWWSQIAWSAICMLHPKQRLGVSLGMEMICPKCGHQYSLEEKSKMQLKPIESSNLAATDHDARTRTLFIKFKGGQVYAYYGVAESVHTSLRRAESPGGYFAEHIKGQYSYARVEG